jgi:hypothetical protein
LDQPVVIGVPLGHALGRVPAPVLREILELCVTSVSFKIGSLKESAGAAAYRDDLESGLDEVALVGLLVGQVGTVNVISQAPPV